MATQTSEPPPPGYKNSKALGLLLCCTAGLLAALGPIFGRLAALSWKPEASREDQASEQSPVFDVAASWILPLCCYAAIVGCNVGMWALQLTGIRSLSTLEATVVNSSTNIVLSGVLGSYWLDETLSGKWLLGVGCISLGLLFLALGSNGDTHTKKQKSE